MAIDNKGSNPPWGSDWNGIDPEESWRIEFDVDVIFNEIDFAAFSGGATGDQGQITVDGIAVLDFSDADLNGSDVMANPFGAGTVIPAGTGITFKGVGDANDENTPSHWRIDSLTVSNVLPLTLTIDRTSMNMMLQNNGGDTIENIVGYSITSEAGTLNSTDGAWSSISDSDVNWVELSNDEGFDLSELEDGPVFAGLDLVTSATLNIGNAWYKHPTEDIEMTVLVDDGSEEGLQMPVTIIYTGGSGSYPEGDLDFDGDVDTDDVTKFSQFFYQALVGTAPGATYEFGDMNGDLISDYQDLLLYRTAYDAANGAGSFATAFGAVPEPSSLVLIGLCACLFLVSIVKKNFGRRAFMLAAFLLAIPCLLINSSHATIVFEEDFSGVTAGTAVTTENSAFTLVSSAASPHALDSTADAGDLFVEGTSNNFITVTDGGSSAPRLVGPADLTSASVFEFSFNFYDPAPADSADHIRIGLGNDNLDNSSKALEFEFRENEFNYRSTNGVFDVAYSQDQKYDIIAVGNYGNAPAIYNGGTEWIAPNSFDVWMNGAKVSDDVPMSNGAPKTTSVGFGGNSSSTGSMYFDNIVVEDTISSFLFEGEALLTLEVNTTTGQTYIKNTLTGIPLDIDFYRISGDAGALDAAGWNSLDEQEGTDPADEGWVAATSSDSFLTEFTLDDSQNTVSTGSPINLGSAFDETSGAGNSLVFEYAINGGGIVTGLVSFVSGGTQDADFDNDGDVDGSDFLAWQTGFGIPSGATQAEGDANADGAVNAADFTIWSSQYGNSSGGGSLAGATVPEPSTFVLLALLALATAAWRKR